MAFLFAHGCRSTRFFAAVSKLYVALAALSASRVGYTADASSLPNSPSDAPLFPLLMPPDPRAPAVRLDGDGWSPAETGETASGLKLAARGRVAEDISITPV